MARETGPVPGRRSDNSSSTLIAVLEPFTVIPEAFFLGGEAAGDRTFSYPQFSAEVKFAGGYNFSPLYVAVGVVPG
jgi:hypothetical protein